MYCRRSYLVGLVGAALMFGGAVSSEAEIIWSHHEGHLYTLTENFGTWLEAEAEAVALGGHLATIDNETENAFLTELAKDTYNRNAGGSGDNLAWMGLRGATTMSGDPIDIYWADGSPVEYTNFFYDGIDDTGYYWYIHGGNHGHNPGQWNKNPLHNEVSDRNLRGIVEKVPEPSVLVLLATSTIGLFAFPHRSSRREV